MPKELLVKRDLSKSLKSKNIVIPEMPVKVNIELDAELQKMAKSGKEGFRLQQLTDAANDGIDKWIDGFQSSIDKVDSKLPNMSSDEIIDKIDELNDVLKKYSKQMEDVVEKEVDKQWKAIVAREKALSKYKLDLAVKTTLATLVMAGNLASLVATSGADVLSWVSLINAAANLSGQLHRECMDIFDHYDRVADMMEKLSDTLNNDLNGFKDTAKGALSDASPALGRFLTSTKGAETELKSLQAKYTAANKDLDNTVGKINAALDKGGKIGKRGIDAKAYEKIQELEKQTDEMLKSTIFMHKLLKKGQEDIDDWGQALKAWNARNPAKATIKKAGDAGKAALSLAKLVNSVLDIASAVKALV
jgi:hypothetical protein